MNRLLLLMTSDHQFIDSLGNIIEGRERLLGPWQQYLAMFPDYHIEIEDIFHAGNTVGVFGTARGSYKGAVLSDNKWEISASWRAEVRDERIAKWQVYADNEPVREVLRRHHGV